MKNGTVYNKGFESPGEEEDAAKDDQQFDMDGENPEQKQGDMSPKRYGGVLKDKIMILGVDGVETVD